MDKSNAQTTELITPKDAGLRLLEAASLAFYRSDGRAGLVPINLSGQPMYRPADLNGFIRAHLGD